MKFFIAFSIVLSTFSFSTVYADSTLVPNHPSLKCFKDGRVEFPEVSLWVDSGKFTGVMVKSLRGTLEQVSLPVTFEYKRGTKVGHWTPFSYTLKIGSETYTSRDSKSDLIAPHRGYFYFEHYWNDENCAGDMPCDYDYQKISLRFHGDRMIGESVLGNQNGPTAANQPIYLCP